jgi:hypothetical protein
LIELLIPIGGKYISDEKEYGAEVLFPTEIKDGDVYILGDYEYKYNYKASLLNTSKWLKNTEQSGWGVRVIDRTKEKYEDILNEVNGKPVTSIRNTFYECENLIEMPHIPDMTVDMFGAFSGCVKLQKISQIPPNVKNISWTFEYCESISELPDIPDGIESANGTFADCSRITHILANFKLKGKNIFINCPIQQVR